MEFLPLVLWALGFPFLMEYERKINLQNKIPIDIKEHSLILIVGCLLFLGLGFISLASKR